MFQSFNLIKNLTALQNVIVPFLPGGVTDQHRREASALLAAVVVAACAKTATKAPPRSERHDEELSLAASDAKALGRDLFVLADKAHDFQASHRKRAPKGLRDLAVDSLTPDFERSLQATDSLRLHVAFRHTDGHALSSCTISLAALEEADLNSGEFLLHCRTVAGSDTTARTTARR